MTYDTTTDAGTNAITISANTQFIVKIITIIVRSCKMPIKSVSTILCILLPICDTSPVILSRSCPASVLST